ncbi:MAG: hypothetical protein IPO36_06360 [Anaerolineales bacterium]|nr:hypothetical protein [Anaerolineales bacterium]
MDILIAEYNYIAETAAQSNEDRARVSSFYLVAVGSLVAALLSTQFVSNILDKGLINILFSILFLLLTLLGTTTILQLTRLRVAWFESLIAMDRIKGIHDYQRQIPGAGLQMAYSKRARSLQAKQRFIFTNCGSGHPERIDLWNRCLFLSEGNSI